MEGIIGECRLKLLCELPEQFKTVRNLSGLPELSGEIDRQPGHHKLLELIGFLVEVEQELIESWGALLHRGRQLSIGRG